jgi:hypothetical protein
MKKLLLCLLGPALVASAAFAGVGYSGKEIKQVAAPPPCPQWYADQEFNVSLWGTYMFTGNSWENDRYLETDHAWGGGGDLKFFFMRYFGVGVEGWAVSARRAFLDGGFDFFQGFDDIHIAHESRAVGAVLGTLTLRYPIPCTRFSPYIFGGGGGIFGGGETTHVVDDGPGAFHFEQSDTQTEAIGQVGGGLEVRFTPHVGWISDFSWNFVDGPRNNFGMVRTGINFAF